MAQTARISSPVRSVGPVAMPSPATWGGFAARPVLDDMVMANASSLRTGAWMFTSLLKEASENRAPLRDFAIFNNWVMVKTDKWSFSPNFRDGNLFREESDDDIDDPSSWLGWPAIEVARRLLASTDPAHRSMGLACLKAVLPIPDRTETCDTFDLIEPLAANCRTLAVGSFPNARCWRDRGWPVAMAEPTATGELDWASIPAARSAELVVVNGSVLLGGGLREMVGATPRAKARILVGPSVPPSQALFRMGIHGLGFSVAGDPGALSEFFRRGSLGLKNAPAGAVKKCHMWCRPNFVQEVIGRRS